VIDIDATDSFEAYESGHYNACDGSAAGINHMVVNVGYDCQTSIDENGNCAFNAEGNPINGDGLLDVRNSWGTSWGEDGYVWIKYLNKVGERCNGVASDALIYDIDITNPPTPNPEPVPSPDPIPWWQLLVGVAASLGVVGVVRLKRAKKKHK